MNEKHADTTTAKIMTARYDGVCVCCGERFRARKAPTIAYLSGVVAHELCHARATNPDTVPSYIPDPAAYATESALYAQRWSAALASRATKPLKATPRLRVHHPDCDAQIPGNPCTCHYEHE